MLESQGTESDDEPARLWSYVAFNDRPFQEILTGEYSVDNDFNCSNGRTFTAKPDC